MSQQEKHDALDDDEKDWQPIVHKYLQHWQDCVPEPFASELKAANGERFWLLVDLYRLDILRFPPELPDAFKEAADAIYYSIEDWQPVVHNFLLHWHDLTPKTLAHVLQAPQEERQDKLFVLYALGYLTFPEASSLLSPFIHSSKQTERWVCILSLGRHREPTVYPLLQSLLLEDLFNPKAPQYDDDDFDYGWYMRVRYEIAFELGDWGNLTALATLCEAIGQCRMFQLHPDQYGEAFNFAEKPPYDLEVYDHWTNRCDRYINVLAIALGTLGARDALAALSLSPAYWRYAQIYFLFGTLRHSEPYPYPPFVKPPVDKSYDGTLQVAYSTIPQILQAFETHFQASKEEQEAFLSEVYLATEQLAYECYPRNMPGYEEYFIEEEKLDNKPF